MLDCTPIILMRTQARMFCSVLSQKASAFLLQLNVYFYPAVTSFLALNSSEKVLPQIRRKLSALVKFDISATAQLMKQNSDGGKDRCVEVP
jgi:hypothetical protein